MQTMLWIKSNTFRDKSLGEITDTGSVPQYNKGSLHQACSQHQVKGKKLKAVPLKSGPRQSCPLFSI